MADLQQTSRIGGDLEFHSQCTAAISAHGDWKFKLKRAITNQAEGLDPAQVSLDNQCAFGKWLYSPSTEPLRTEKSYTEILELHAIFHQEAAQIVRLCQAARTSEAEKKMRADSAYSKVSAQLTTAVKNWIALRQTNAAKEVTQIEQESQIKAWQLAPLSGAVIGIAAGLGFVVTSIAITFSIHSLPWQIFSVLQAHRLSPNNWLVDCAPPTLGILGFYIGKFLREQKRQNVGLQNLVEKRTEQLVVQQKDLRRIFDNLDEGIFTIRKNREIGPDYSPAVESVLQNTEIDGNTLRQIFSGRVDSATLAELDGYLDLLFDGAHKESMLRDLNPFENLRTAGTDAGNLKVISVRFQRLLDSQGKVDAILCVAKDVTAEQLLREELAEQQNAASSQMAQIREIFEVGPEMLSFFRQQVVTELNGISDTLRSPGELNLRAALAAIFRSLHSIKGSAALLGLSRIAKEAHRYEDKVGEIGRKEEIDQMDFLPLMISHATLLRELETFENLLAKIRNFQQTPEAQKTDGASLLSEILQRLVRQSADESGKKVVLVLDRFTPDNLPHQWTSELRDILTQIIRNSIAHGIESPQKRTETGKPETGSIKISVIPGRRHTGLLCRDDGAGFAVDKIRQRILEKNLLSAGQLDALSDAEAVAYIFEPGFSTADNVDLSAGRGVGMDLVREKLRSLGGKIRVQWKKGKSTQFLLLLPTHKSA